MPRAGFLSNCRPFVSYEWLFNTRVGPVANGDGTESVSVRLRNPVPTDMQADQWVRLHLEVLQ